MKMKMKMKMKIKNKIQKNLLLLFCAAFLTIGLAACSPKPTAHPTESITPSAPVVAEGSSYYPVTVAVYNNAGEAIPYTFEQCPEKTLVYGRNNVEIMLALGLEDRIQMVADCSSVLPEYEAAFQKLDLLKKHQDIGYFVREYALSLEPDMVIGWYSLFNMADRMGDVAFWHERKIGTYTSINSVGDVAQSLENEYQDIRNLAAIYNKQAEAEQIIAEIQGSVALGKKAAGENTAQRVLILEKYKGEYDIFHRKTAVGDIAAALGAEPLGAMGWNDEQIVAANPEVIFAVHIGSVTPEEAIALYAENPALASIDAVKNGRIYPMAYSLAYSPGVRTRDTVKQFLANLYAIK